MKSNLVLVICVLFLEIVSGQKRQEESNWGSTLPIKIRIDPLYAQGAVVSDIFDSVRYIPLEMTKQSAFGFIEKLQVSKQFFVFFDMDTKAIYTFDKAGSFVGKINRLPLEGWNSNDFISLSNFVLNKEKELIYVIHNDHDHHTKWLLVFSVKGNLLEKKKLPGFMNGLSDRFSFVDSNRCIFARNFFPEKDFNNLSPQSYFYTVQNFDSIVSGIAPVNKEDVFLKREAMNGFELSSFNNDYSIWSRQMDYSLRLSDRRGNCTTLNFVFPQGIAIDSSLYKDSITFRSNDKSSDYLSNNQVVGNVNSIGLYNDWLIFNYEVGTSGSMRYNFLFTLRQQNVYCFDKITPDSLSYFLPIGNAHINAITDGYIYNEVASYQMFNSLKERKDEPWRGNKVLESFFATQSRKSNPVIVELKLKENL